MRPLRTVGCQGVTIRTKEFDKQRQCVRTILLVTGFFLCGAGVARAQIPSFTINQPVMNQYIIQQTQYTVAIAFQAPGNWQAGDTFQVTLTRNMSGNPPALGGQSTMLAVPDPNANNNAIPIQYVTMTAPPARQMTMMGMQMLVSDVYTLSVQYYRGGVAIGDPAIVNPITVGP